MDVYDNLENNLKNDLEPKITNAYLNGISRILNGDEEYCSRLFIPTFAYNEESMEKILYKINDLYLKLSKESINLIEEALEGFF